MTIEVPSEYIVSVDGADWRAEYVGSGHGALAGAGVMVGPEQAQFKVPEGTLVVAAPGAACVLVTASPDENAVLGEQQSSSYHLYRLIPLGRLQ